MGSKRKSAIVAGLLAMLAGCGYVGDPLPPALHIPKPVADLSAMQRGDTIEIRFSAPAQTTEDLGIREFASMDLRVGPPAGTLEAWEATAKPVTAALPEPGSAVLVKVPAAEWAGREILIAARFVGTRGRRSGWSNTVSMTPRAPLPPPVLKAELHPAGVRLSWPSGEARIYRGDDLIGAATSEFIDRTAEVGKAYSYRAQAVDGTFESTVSQPVFITMADKFAPSPPANVTAVVGLEAVEIAWEPNTEPDLSVYRVYRASASGDFAALGDVTQAPSFSDRTAPAGVNRYRVTAIDKTGNESAPSAVVEVTR